MTLLALVGICPPRQGHQSWNSDGAIGLSEDPSLYAGLEASPLLWYYSSVELFTTRCASCYVVCTRRVLPDAALGLRGGSPT